MGILDKNDKPYWQLLPLLMLLAVLMFTMNSYMPPSSLAPKGYSSSILAFEFAKTRSDVNEVFILLSADQIKGMDLVNYIDFGFMLAYSALLAGFFWLTKKMENHKYLILGLVLSLLAFLGDFFENIQLLDLSEMFVSNAPPYSYESVLANLSTFTWLKWGSLSVAMALLVPVLWKRNLLSKVAGVIFSLPLLLLILTWIIPGRAMLDKFGTSVIFGFVMLAIYIVAYKDAKQG